MRHGNLINVKSCLNCAEEVLFPNVLKTHLRFVDRGVVTHIREDKHTATIITVGENQWAGRFIRHMTHRVSARGECLSTGDKLEGQLHNNVVVGRRLRGSAEPKNENDRD